MTTLKSAVLDSELMNRMRKPKTDRGPEPKAALDNIARSVSVFGKVLEGAAQEHGLEKGASSARWLIRAGLFFQGLVMVSLPQTWRNNWARVAVSVLYVVEGTLLVLGVLFDSQDVRVLAVTALVITLAVHLMCAIMRDFAAGRQRWLRVTVGVVKLALSMLVVIGALTAGRWAFCDQTSTAEQGRETFVLCPAPALLAQRSR